MTAGRPTCPSALCSIFPSPEQTPGLSHYQGLLNSGGSLPDLSNLHFPSPLSTPLDPDDGGGYANLSGGSSTGNLPAAMMHLGIGNSQGGRGQSGLSGQRVYSMCSFQWPAGGSRFAVNNKSPFVCPSPPKVALVSAEEAKLTFFPSVKIQILL